MLLQPIDPAAGPELDDPAAARPRELPGKAELVEETARLVERLDGLQRALFAEAERAVLVVLQGRDASGKDGLIRRVFGPLNGAGAPVTAFAAPAGAEREHDFLWRVHAAAPRRGQIAVFNRSHYEDVLAARVHGLVPRARWERRFEHINAWERMLADEGTTIVKFFLHISRQEQGERLLARLDDPAKNWKFDPSDLEDRARWDEYTGAYRDVLARCATPWAPWYLVPADSKRARDYLVARVLVEVLEGMNPQFPEADPEVLKLRDRI